MMDLVSLGSVGVMAAIGLLVVVQVFVRGMKPPADESNRIAHLILVWEALKSPQRFVNLRDEQGRVAFPYLTEDLRDSINRMRP